MQARWDDVVRVVDQALDLELTARPELLGRTCSGDAALRAEVDRLLDAAARAGDFLDRPAAADVAPLVSWVARQESQALAAGARFGVYEVTGLLGRGGMATVYLAQDHKHHRAVAVKVFDPEVGAAIGREWFLREIDIAAGLHHPHILPLHDSGDIDGRLYYVMPHVEGESLRQRLSREGRIPLASARRIVQEVAGALDYAHRQGVVHRDIKPENILLQDGQAIVADFGIARAIDAGVVDAGTTETIPALGTPAYMSPEQATRTAGIDGRSDVYALGCVLYEMLVGAPPFSGPTVQAILDQHMAHPVPSLRTLRPDLPLAVDQAIARALQKSPADRFATAGELVEAIDLAAGGPVAKRAGHRSRVRIATAVAVSAVVTLAAIAAGRREAAPARLDPDLVAILPFSVEGSNPRLSWLRQGAADLLASKLAGDAGLRAADPRSVRSAWQRVAGSSEQGLTRSAGRDVARSVGAGHLVDGRIVGSPEHLTLAASLITTRDGPELAHASVEGPSDSLPVLLDRLAVRLLTLGAGGDAARLFRRTPASLPALRAFLAGRAAFRTGRVDSASSRFQQATILDSTFALAALELLHLRRGGEEGRRARRLALAGRAQLNAADQALLDIWTGPFPTGPEWLDRWQRASAAYPDRSETWYGLGDAYFHQGLSAGVADPFRLAAEAFQRGRAIDSAGANDAQPGERSSMVAEPLGHMVEIAQARADTASVLRLVALGLPADSTTSQGWYLRWHRALALGASARRAFWADSQSVNPDAFALIFRFIESSGVAVEDYVRAANLDIRHWEASGPAGGSFERAMVALDGGRPRESARFLAEIEHAATVEPGERPMGWRLGEVGDPGLINLALYWGADTAGAAQAARRLTPAALGVSLAGDEARDQLEARCAVATWRAARGDVAYADAAVRRLREARVRGLHGVDSTTLGQFRTLCAALLDATRATVLRLPDARRKLEQADAASRTYDLFLPALGANLVVAHLAELQGDLPLALRAVRRRAGHYGLFPSWHLSTFLRVEGRLAALTADTAGAVRAYRHYLALRTNPEPEIRPEVERVRAELAKLVPVPPGSVAVSANPNLVAVLPFRIAGAKADLAWLHEGLVDLLAIRLTGEAGLSVAEPRAVLSAWNRVAESKGQAITPEAALGIARRLGAGRVIDGGVVGTSQALTLTASLLTTANGRISARASVEGPADSLPALVDRLTARLLSEEAGVHNSQLASLASTSLPAIRAYLTGRTAFRKGNWDEAFRQFHQATLLDSTFALAALEGVHASYYTASSGESREVGRAKRLARAGRERLGPGDRALLDVWAAPFATAPELFQRWQAASKEYPDRAEIWYGLGDAYYHDGMFAGLVDPLRLAAGAFRRGWAIDSASGTVSLAPGRSPMLTHMVEIAQVDGDTAAVRRLVGPRLAADSTGAQGWYLRWHRALTLGSSARRAFWADSQGMDPETFTLIHRFTASAGVATQDYLRAADLMIRQWEVGDPGDAAFARHVVALNGGRPREAARALPASARGVSVGLPIREALYWGGDTSAAVETARRLAPPAAGPVTGGEPGMSQLHSLCALATWRIARSDYRYAEAAIRRLRAAAVVGLPADDSIAVTQYTALCAALMEATRATDLRLPEARTRLEHADTAARTFIVGQSLAANLVVARLAEAQGDLHLALRAVRRRAGRYNMLPAWYLSTFLREEGRLAAMTGDTAGAVRAYRHYLAMRTNPEPEVKPEVERVRAELAKLLSEPRR